MGILRRRRRFSRHYSPRLRVTGVMSAGCFYCCPMRQGRLLKPSCCDVVWSMSSAVFLSGRSKLPQHVCVCHAGGAAECCRSCLLQSYLIIPPGVSLMAKLIACFRRSLWLSWEKTQVAANFRHRGRSLCNVTAAPAPVLCGNWESGTAIALYMRASSSRPSYPHDR